MLLTKTDFKYFLNCPESFWLLKNKPKIFEKYKGEFTLFAQKLVAEGYEVEAYAKLLFPDGLEIPENASIDYTKKALVKDYQTYFQPSFKSNIGCFARIDILEKLDDDTWHLYEVKSSSSVNKDRKHRHIEDACFQKFVLHENYLNVSKVSIIHLNKAYVKQGDIIPKDLLQISDITEQVAGIYSGVVNQINAAIILYKKSTIDESRCSCYYKTRSNHCDTFDYFNMGLPKPSVHEIKLISKKKLGLLLDQGNESLLNVPPNFDLNTGQRLQVQSFQQNKPIMTAENIKKVLQELPFPLHFFDYETFKSAVPKLDGLKPHQNLPFQVSIHTMKESGVLSHFEFLADSLEMPDKMLKGMYGFTGNTGTFLSWHASFEASRNREMQEWLPEYYGYLEYINTHMFDLEDIFKTDYMDWRFKGSSSIKKVLPVLVPDMSYDSLEVGEGTEAMDVWERLVIKKEFEGAIDETRKNLLEYCKLDTLAMVEIYNILVKL